MLQPFALSYNRLETSIWNFDRCTFSMLRCSCVNLWKTRWILFFQHWGFLDMKLQEIQAVRNGYKINSSLPSVPITHSRVLIFRYPCDFFFIG